MVEIIENKKTNKFASKRMLKKTSKVR
jgi:hypothetical protein